MPVFTIYPAIDLRAGQVVRLKQGDPKRQTTYQYSPGEAAREWIQHGAHWLHVINLSGAFGEGGGVNLAALEAILAETGQTDPPVKVQFGGGLRTLEQIDAVLSSGVERVILGTIAITAPDLLRQAVSGFGAGAIAVAVDVRAGSVRVKGWQRETQVDPLDLAHHLEELGVQTIIFTNISRDGLGRGVDATGAGRLALETGLSVIAAGGVNSLQDIHKARAAGLNGVVIGRALYEGKFNLKEALAC